MVTHDMGEAAFFGERVMMLSEGAIVQEGRLEELIEHPSNAYVSRFINAQRLPGSSSGSLPGNPPGTGAAK